MTMKFPKKALCLACATLCSVGLLSVEQAANAATHEVIVAHKAVPLAAIQRMLPAGSQLLKVGPKQELMTAVDMDRGGTPEYAALYKYQKGGFWFAGAVIVGKEAGKVQKLWQYTGNGLVMPAQLSVRDMLHNGKQEVIFQATVGAMANYYEILAKSEGRGGRIQSIFSTSAKRVDIGNYDMKGPNEIAVWSLDTGNLYNIQLYGWNQLHYAYQAAPNTTAPSYFKNAVIPYYQSLRTSKRDDATPKMTAYGLAQACYDAGEYQKAMVEITRGLKLGKADYPANSKFIALKNQIEKAMSR